LKNTGRQAWKKASSLLKAAHLYVRHIMRKNMLREIKNNNDR